MNEQEIGGSNSGVGEFSEKKGWLHWTLQEEGEDNTEGFKEAKPTST